MVHQERAPLSTDGEDWSHIVDPGGDADAPRPDAISPGLEEYKVVAAVGPGGGLGRIVALYCHSSVLYQIS